MRCWLRLIYVTNHSSCYNCVGCASVVFCCDVFCCDVMWRACFIGMNEIHLFFAPRNRWHVKMLLKARHQKCTKTANKLDWSRPIGVGNVRRAPLTYHSHSALIFDTLTFKRCMFNFHMIDVCKELSCPPMLSGRVSGVVAIVSLPLLRQPTTQITGPKANPEKASVPTTGITNFRADANHREAGSVYLI